MSLSKTILNYLLKASIAGFCIFFIYKRVVNHPEIEVMTNSINTKLFGTENMYVAIVLLLLMIVNWFLEAIKWKLLLNRIEPVGLLKSFRSVLSGVTVGLFTPNRVGEFAGRVLHLESGTRIKAAIASVIGSMNQLLVTIIAGSIGLLVSLPDYFAEDILLSRVVSLLILCAMIAITIFYFRMTGIHHLAVRFESLRKLTLYTRVFELYNLSELFKLSLLSIMRYIVFSFQFIIMLEVFNIQLSYLEAFRLISLIYLVLAIVPSFAITELTVRGSVALYFLSPVTGNSVGILAATSLLWLLNLVIPAAIGAFAVFYFRINK